MAKTKIQWTANNLNNNFSDLSGHERENVNNIDTITITGAVQRSATVERLNTFVISMKELTNSTISTLSSDILHEGGHVRLFNESGGDPNASRGLNAEVQLTQEQINVIGRLHGEQTEIDQLQRFLDNPNLIRDRLNLSPFTPPSAGGGSYQEFFTELINPVYMDFPTFEQQYGRPSPGSDWP